MSLLHDDDAFASAHAHAAPISKERLGQLCSNLVCIYRFNSYELSKSGVGCLTHVRTCIPIFYI